MSMTIRKIIRTLSRPDMVFWSLPYLMLLLAAGTIAQKFMDLHTAQTIFFSSFILWAGPVPLPGGYTVSAFITLCLTLKFIFGSEWSWRKAGTILSHFGVLILLIGGIFTAFASQEGIVRIAEGTQSRQVMDMSGKTELATLPFTVTLGDVVEDLYPGTGMARSYHSDIVINDSKVDWPARISMNKPLRYKGYTFYQSEYSREGAKEFSTFTVVRNTGRLFPYISCAVIAAGLILHVLISAPRAAATIMLLALMLPAGAKAASMDMSAFRAIPVQHEGRIKPMDSFARTHLRVFSGSEHAGKLDAAKWMAEAMFDPLEAGTRDIFQVRNKDVVDMLGLPERLEARYSFVEITPVLQKKQSLIAPLLTAESKNLSQAQKDLLDLNTNVFLFTQIMRSFSLILPLSVEVPKSLGNESQTQDYLELQKLRERAENKVASIIRAKGDDPANYTDEEQKIALFAWQMRIISDAAADNLYVRLIAPEWDGGKGEWLSPWAALQSGRAGPVTMAAISHWKNAATAWLSDDAQGWLAATKSLAGAPSARIAAELSYNSLHPYELALGLYILSALLLAFTRTAQYAWVPAAIGAAFHIFAIAARIFILARPPVGTLYESLIFVALICAIAGIAGRNNRVILGGGVAMAAILLAVSGWFAQQGGDTLGMLVAVLNTNFWLATHVLCITGGYGLSLMAGTAAHVRLAREPGGNVPAYIQRLMLVALMLTATGTMLGGIWADQSWGRFWGWDPKENGALLIVLWIVWLLHGRMAGLLRPATYLAGLCALNIVVALAWFGVNLLSVGLHSYGFISGVAASLAVFCGGEAALIYFLWRRAKRNVIQSN